MAKGGDLWDDSALIDAFDNAVSTYKKMHKKKSRDSVPDNGEVVSVLDNTDAEINNENAAAFRNAEYFSIQTANGLTADDECNDLPLISKDPVPETTADSGTQDPTFDHHSAELDGYNQLLGQYYELEASRQKVLEQLSQYGYSNYQNYGASQVEPGSKMAGASSFTQDHVSTCPVTCPADIYCCCPYVCPSSAEQCTLSSYSIGGTAGIQHHGNAAMDNCGIRRTAMEAVGKAMSSLKVKAPTSQDKEAEVEGDKADTRSTETDITDVMNAWYTAGLYTGKYLAEQSAKEKPRG